ncbi:MAG: energy-coupling factor ABC transporter ATP-binding protein [Spirochaetaceae bacterium]|nr:energy-coupling factor ABC transporter ATP-binding protein [Spirochaetaceae bacterium]
MSDFLKVKDISFRYPQYKYVKEKNIFNNFSFSLKKGEITLFLAPPESGKTTLSGILTSLVPRYTGGNLDGNIFIDGTDITEERAYNLITKIGIVFQNPEEQILTTEVESEIGFALEALGHDYDFIKNKTDDVLEKIGIAHLKGMNPSQLSGGEKRKLLLAALLALDPEIWVLDETFEEIDPQSRVSLLNLLRDLNKTVFILTSKMLDIYKKYCSRFFLYDGKELIEETKIPDTLDTSDTPNMQKNSFMAKAIETGLYLDTEKINPESKQSNGQDPGAENIFLKAENIYFKYDNGDFALNINDFYLKSGEIVVLIGKNGSGKSTFAKIISGLLKPSAGSGKIMIDDNGKLKERSSDELNKNVSYFFQNPDLQLFLPTVGEELAFGLKGSSKDKSEIKKLVNEAIDLFHLDNCDMPPALMSYGARKRLQAAIYYLLNKKIVIIDEADSGISFKDYAFIIKNIRSLDPVPAIMIISHDIKLSVGFADRIIIMENGTFVESDCEKKLTNLLDISTTGDG